MKRRGVAAVLTLLTACTAGAPRPTPASPSSPLGTGVRGSRLPPLVLRADLSDRPAGWRRVALIRFGPQPDELGIVPEGRHSPVPLVPFAFAVAGDRSLWILDEVKRRVAHYSLTGRFLGSVEGLRFDRSHAHPRDLVMAGGHPVVLEQRNWSLAGIVDVPEERGRRFSRTPVTIGGEPAWVSYLVPTSGPVVGWINGTATLPPAPPRPSPRGAARFDVPGSGRGRLLPGLPLGDGGYVRIDFRQPQDFAVTFTRPPVRTALPVHVDLIGGGRQLDASAAVISEVPLDHGIAALVQIAPTRPVQAHRFGDGRWFLELSDDGSPLRWERIGEPAFDDESVVRHLTSGPEGAIYLMRAHRGGISVFRR